MYLPVGEPIRFNTQAQDVIHSFYVREFLFKRDAFPDHVNTFDITITKPGDYGGQCTEYCGLAHQAMRFTVRAVSRPQFEAWLVKAKKEAASGCPDDPNPRSIAAKDIAFNKECLAGPVNRPFEITFENQEAVPHNVAFYETEAADQADPPARPDAAVPRPADGHLRAARAQGRQVLLPLRRPRPGHDRASSSFSHGKEHDRWRSRKPGPRQPPTRRTASALGATRSWTG